MQRYNPRTALIVVDVQNDFADPAGSLSVTGGADDHPDHQHARSRRRRIGRRLRRRTRRTGTRRRPRTSRRTAASGPSTASPTRGARNFTRTWSRSPARRVRKGVNGEDGYSGFTMRDPVTGETIPTELEGLLRAARRRAGRRLRARDGLLRQGDRARRHEAGLRDVPPGRCHASGRSQPWRRRSGGRGSARRRRRRSGRQGCADDVQLHLVDATYELFRAHYAPRPDVRGRDGTILSGVSGLCDQLLYLLREEGATHVGCATDRVIESFRNDMFPGYKSSAGMPPELLAQFPIAEEAIEALGIVLWPMVEWEADDAIAAAADRFAADPEVERIVVCTPDKDMAQLVSDARVVLWDRRRGLIVRRCRRSGEVGRRAAVDSGLARRSSATRPMATRACRDGARSRRRPFSRSTARSRGSRAQASHWEVPSLAWRARPRRHPARAVGRRDALPGPRPASDDGGRRPDPPGDRRGSAMGWGPARSVGGILRSVGPDPPALAAPSLAGRLRRAATASSSRIRA